MKLRRLLKHHTFLLRLISASALIIAVAVLVSVVLVARRARVHLEKNNMEMRIGMAQTFSDYFNEQLSQLMINAVRIRYEQLVEEKTLKSHVYHEIVAINNLSHYLNGAPIAEEVCVYFMGSDYVITSRAKYNMDFFAGEHIAAKDTALKASAMDFIKTPHESRIAFFSTFDRIAPNEQKLLISVNTQVSGKVCEGDMQTIYLVTPESLSTSFLKAIGKNECMLAIIDQEGNKLFQNRDLGIGDLDNFLPELLEKGSGEYARAGQIYDAYAWNDRRNNLSFLIVLPREIIEQSMMDYSRTMQTTVWTSIILLSLCTGVSIYFSYRPIRDAASMTRNLTSPDYADGGEIESIVRMIDLYDSQSKELNTLIADQRMILMDAIMSNLLNGLPISREMAVQAGFALGVERFCAVTVKGLNSMDNATREALSDEIAFHTGAHVLLLDVPYERHMILVCGLPKQIDIRSFIDMALMSLQIYADGALVTGVGNEVVKPSDLHISFMYSLSALNEGGTGVTFYNDLINALGTLEHYPTGEVLEFLRHVESGSSVKAILAIERIQEHMKRHVHSAIYERYACFNILGSLTKLASRMEIALPNDVMNRLLLVSGFEEFKQLLASVVMMACEEMNRRKETRDAISKNAIVSYVDEHYANPEISLIQVADVFGMSIYTLSRIFKEASGLGFKEYVMSKRMKYARELLRTTSLSIKEIAARAGFNNPDYFTRIFKGYFNSSPSDMRKSKFADESDTNEEL